MPRSSLYHARQFPKAPRPRPTPAHALSESERHAVRDLLNSERFQDLAPRQVWATLLDEGIYHCSWRTMYRVLHEHQEVRERRNQRRHPNYSKPELLATRPNELWSWGIARMRGPRKWQHFYLYVILDVYSRYVVGWMIADYESAALAERFIEETCIKQRIAPEQLTLHADRGAAMCSTPVMLLLKEWGILKTHSRPYTATDNPYSEAHFKTMKYRPGYPDRFASIEAARQWARAFFQWYNRVHYHVGLNLMTPASVHYGHARTVVEQRNRVLQLAYAAHPERFPEGLPTTSEPPRQVWINKPIQVLQVPEQPINAR